MTKLQITVNKKHESGFIRLNFYRRGLDSKLRNQATIINWRLI